MSHQFTSEKAWTQPAASTLKLEEGLHVALAAGIFNLDAPLQVNNPNTLILGLGMATLVSSIGNAVISVADMPGVRVAGLLLSVGPLPTMAVGVENQFVCRRCAESWNVARGGCIEDEGHFIELFRCVRQIEHCHSFQFRFGATWSHD